MALVAVPLLCSAQQTGTDASSGSGAVVAQPPADTGAVLLARLERLADGAFALKDLEMTQKERDAWTAETKRYAERSAELRARCHDEIRRANRDTIASKAAQCLRSDLLLEATHRRKQRDLFAGTKGVAGEYLAGATTAIDAWLDAATSIVDGIDAGVFTTVDALKTAKRNLHATYRVPMYDAFNRVRTMHASAILSSVAAQAVAAMGGEPRPVLATLVPCLDAASTSLGTGFHSTGGYQLFREGAAELRRCVGLIEDAE